MHIQNSDLPHRTHSIPCTRLAHATECAGSRTPFSDTCLRGVPRHADAPACAHALNLGNAMQGAAAWCQSLAGAQRPPRRPMPTRACAGRCGQRQASDVCPNTRLRGACTARTSAPHAHRAQRAGASAQMPALTKGACTNARTSACAVPKHRHARRAVPKHRHARRAVQMCQTLCIHGAKTRAHQRPSTHKPRRAHGPMPETSAGAGLAPRPPAP